ncbi:hypothetical protein XENORESO_006323 [Xenotaenia resolanae]|uniref:Uncharacterized protein n=1 Tax=Xenotaenia resolanae TaxID=208358 RepID=A0ABV0WVW2_9TELE
MQNENMQNNTKKENLHKALWRDRKAWLSLLRCLSHYKFQNIFIPLTSKLTDCAFPFLQSGVVNQPSSLVVAIPCPKVDMYCFIVPTASFYCLQLPRTSQPLFYPCSILTPAVICDFSSRLTHVKSQFNVPTCKLN